MDNVNVSKKSRYYMIELLLEGAMRCSDSDRDYCETRYNNQAIGYTYALSCSGIIDGFVFKELTYLITHKYYKLALGTFKHVLQDND